MVDSVNPEEQGIRPTQTRVLRCDLPSVWFVSKSSFNWVCLWCWYWHESFPHLICKVGGLVTLRNNEVREINEELLATVCKDVKKESAVDDSNENNLRADVTVWGFWQRWCSGFLPICPKISKPIPPNLILDNGKRHTAQIECGSYHTKCNIHPPKFL